MIEKVKSLKIISATVEYRSKLLKFPDIYVTNTEYPIQIFGGNGSGKTTLFMVLAGIIPDIISADLNIKVNINTDVSRYDILSLKTISNFVPQYWMHGSLGYDTLTELDLASKESCWRRYVVSELEIGNFYDKSISRLSDGEKKRLLIALAIANDPPLLISDEWEAHLDCSWIDTISGLLEKYIQRGGAHLSLHSSQAHIRSPTTFELGNNAQDVRSKSTIYKIGKKVGTFIPSFKNKNVNIKTKVSLPDGEDVQINGTGGDVVELIGPNGSGKTSAIRELWRKTHHPLRSLIYWGEVLKPILYIPAEPVYQTLGPSVQIELQRALNQPATDLIEQATAILGTDPDTDVLSLSTGQRKLLSIITGAVSAYPILAIDEPFVALDKQNKRLVRVLIKMSTHHKKLVIITSQEKKYRSANRSIKI